VVVELAAAAPEALAACSPAAQVEEHGNGKKEANADTKATALFGG